MGFWIQLGLWVLTTAISLLIGGPRANNDVEQITSGDLTVPNSEGGQIIPPIFGTPWVENAGVAWWGDLVVEDVKKSGGKK